MRPVQLYLLLIGFHLGQLLWYAPRLPAVVPAHFDAAGVADGWMARGAFLAFLAPISRHDCTYCRPWLNQHSLPLTE